MSHTFLIYKTLMHQSYAPWIFEYESRSVDAILKSLLRFDKNNQYNFS